MKAPLRHAFLLVGIALALLLASSQANAQENASLPERNANFTWERELLRASFSYRDVVDRKVVEKLSSGIPTIIALRAYVLREGEDTPIALSVRTCRVVYDLWDEVFRIRITGPGADRNIAAINTEGVLRQCTEVKDLPVATRALFSPGRPYFLGVIVEVNPVSPETLEQMRKWLSRPAGAVGIGPGDALFGSFVGLFVRQIGTSDRALRFRTQTISP